MLLNSAIDYWWWPVEFGGGWTANVRELSVCVWSAKIERLKQLDRREEAALKPAGRSTLLALSLIGNSFPDCNAMLVEIDLLLALAASTPPTPPPTTTTMASWITAISRGRQAGTRKSESKEQKHKWQKQIIETQKRKLIDFCADCLAHTTLLRLLIISLTQSSLARILSSFAKKVDKESGFNYFNWCFDTIATDAHADAAKRSGSDT